MRGHVDQSTGRYDAGTQGEAGDGASGSGTQGHESDAGTEVPLTLVREGDTFDVRIGSANRDDFLKKPHLH